MQVLNEYFVHVTEKLEPGLTHAEAWDDNQTLQAWNPLPMDFSLQLEAFHLREQHAFSWWDALIVGAAKKSQCPCCYRKSYRIEKPAAAAKCSIRSKTILM